MAGISITVDASELERLRSLVSRVPGGVMRLGRSVMRELTRSAKGIASEESSRVYYIQRGRVTRAITLRGSSVIVRGTRQNVSDFRMTPKSPGKRRKNGIRVGVMREGGMKAIRRGFVIRGKDSGKSLGMRRTGRGRRDFRALISPAIPQMMENERVQAAMIERLNRSAVELLNLWAWKIVAGR